VVGPSKQANIHTHGCNEVTLVWGSLRLAPITSQLAGKAYKDSDYTLKGRSRTCYQKCGCHLERKILHLVQTCSMAYRCNPVINNPGSGTHCMQKILGWF